MWLITLLALLKADNYFQAVGGVISRKNTIQQENSSRSGNMKQLTESHCPENETDQQYGLFQNDGELRLLRSALLEVNDVIIITDAQLQAPGPHIVFVNSAFCGMTGYTAQEVIGKNPRLLQGAKTDRREVVRLRKALEKGQRYYGSAVNYRKDGGEYLVEWSIAPIHDESGQITHYVAVQRDITQERQDESELREREEHYRLLADNSLDLIALLELNGTIIYASPSHRQVLGYDAENLVHSNVFDAIHSEDIPLVSAAVNRLLKGSDHETVEIRLRHQTNTYLVVEANLSVATDNRDGKQHLLLSARDITARKTAEEISQREHESAKNARREAENARREAENARREAERANQAKNDFLSRISHELRTPLNAILGFGQLLEFSDLDEESAESVQSILKGGRHLLKLINEVLDISRIEAGQFNLSLEPISISEICAESLALVRHLISGRGIQIENQTSSCSRFVQADRQRLQQVLVNLLSNAAKYNREDGKITVWWREVSDEHIRIGVTDIGDGIAVDKQKRLFMPFERLGAENTGIEGVGIGLALSQRLAEVMNGSLNVESVPGEGSRFWIELPQAKKPTPKILDSVSTDGAFKDGASKNGGPTSDGHALSFDGKAFSPRSSDTKTKQKTVLYIEDNLSNLQLLERLIANRPNIKLLTERDGSSGLEAARRLHPDLVLLDLNLPEMEGPEVLQHLRADTNTANIPVIVISADATLRQIERLLAAGAQQYLTKPFDIQEFYHVLDAALSDEQR